VRGHSFLGNIEYTWVLDQLQHGIMVFYDAGTAWNSLQLNVADTVVLQSVGFAFKTLDDDFQVDFAWPVGSIGGQLAVSVRLNRTF
jgi:hemolysin activation/secretion protein